MSCFPRQDVASLTGQDWLNFLERQGGDFGAYAELLLEGPYRQQSSIDMAGLLLRAEEWIKVVSVPQVRQ